MLVGYILKCHIYRKGGKVEFVGAISIKQEAHIKEKIDGKWLQTV